LAGHRVQAAALRSQAIGVFVKQAAVCENGAKGEEIWSGMETNEEIGVEIIEEKSATTVSVSN
jgi:hypothetical protein